MTDGTDHPQDIATSDDISHLYRLFLRREPEAFAPNAYENPRYLRTLVQEMLLSEEFISANLRPLQTDHLPATSLDPVPPETLEWAAVRLGLKGSTKRTLRLSRSYLQAYAAIVSDSGVRAVLGSDRDVYDQARRAKLEAASTLQALADMPIGHTLTGWARTTEMSATPFRVEIWANGAYLGTTTTGLYRHDAASRLGSPGYEGFQYELPTKLSGRTHVLLRDPKTKLILADISFDLPSAADEPLEALRTEIEGLKQAVLQLEQRLPERLQSSSYPIGRYAEYYDRWVRNSYLTTACGDDVEMVVLLDATESRQSEVEDALWSLIEQSHQAFSVIVGVRQKDLAFLQDVMTRVRWRRHIPIDYVVAEQNPAWRSSSPMGDAIRVVQLMRASGVIHRDALRCMSAPFRASATLAAAYCDEDEFVPSDLKDWRERRHAGPKLKPSFDYDLLLQTAYVGSFIAVGRDRWGSVIANMPTGEASAGRLLPQYIALLAARTEAPIIHVAEILYTRSDPDIGHDNAQWGRLVEACLGDIAIVEPYQDVLGAEARDACRIRWRQRKEASAVVIVPTRDRLDLIQPCIESVLASLPMNQTRARVRIIDHESAEDATLAFLSTISSNALVDVARFTGAFNWALMNNLASHEATEDVLIFLNNDTLVVSEEWIDELASLAMRDDVGVVGCRLIYDDGAIQHAGFLALDERQRFLSHDGLGDHGSFAGYLGRNALVHRTVAVTGACMAVRRSVFRHLGGFDAARFQVEANDVDLCFKASDEGLKVLYTPFATLHHLESRTRTLDTEDDVRMSGDAAARIWARWGEKVCPDPWYNPRFDRRSRHFSRLIPKETNSVIRQA